MFRKFLIDIRKYTLSDRNKLYTYTGIVAVFLIICSFVVDHFLPFTLWYNFLRSIILIPLCLCIFIIGYSISILLHESKFEKDPEWVPYRLRLSVSWRRRIAVIIVAFLIVIAYATTKQMGYTLISSSLAAIIIALVAYIRPTIEEQNRETLELPDIRDIRYQDQLEQLQQRREKIKKQKSEGKLKLK